jgi:hypothetical protein
MCGMKTALSGGEVKFPQPVETFGESERQRSVDLIVANREPASIAAAPANARHRPTNLCKSDYHLSDSYHK